MERKIFDVITKLINTKGTKAKALYVGQLPNELSKEEFEILIDIFRLQFDPHKKTNIGRKSLSSKTRVAPTLTIVGIPQLLDYLVVCTGKDVEIANIKCFLGTLDEDMVPLYENICIQNLKIGITGEAINKALGDSLIYVFSVWKGQALKDYSKLNNRSIVVTEKIDGYRSCICEDVVISTNGIEQPLSNFPEIEAELNKLPKELREGRVFDGEMLYNKEPHLDRITRYNRTSSIMGADNLKKDITFNVFDSIPIEEFNSGKSSKTTIERKTHIEEAIVTYLPNSESVRYLKPLYVGSEVEVIQELFADAIRKGDEGLILQTTNSHYETRKVSDGMWKLKVRNTADLEVVGFEEGKDTGKNKGTLGNLLVRYKGSICGVGTGFKELIDSEKYPITHTRDWIWKNRDTLIGSIVEIEYDENKNKDGEFNIRHGVFLRWRTDKKEVSYE